VKAPRPTALRLHTRVRDKRRLPVPFGLTRWSDDASDVAVLLETAGDDWKSLDRIVAQLPEAASLPADATLVVLGRAVRNESSWRRWVGDRMVPVPRALRCTALLVRGYVDIGATTDEGRADLVWGFSRFPC
jgi:hypothetical protein